MNTGYIVCVVTNGQLKAKEIRREKDDAFEFFRKTVEGIYQEVYPRLVPHMGFDTTQMTDDGDIRSTFIYDDYLNTTYVIMQPTRVLAKFQLN